MADNLGANPIPQQPNDFPRQAKKLVESIVTEGATEDYLKEAQANVVWFGYVLGNWKALVSTTIPDGRYYEVTYNKGKSEIYIDVYQKIRQHVFSVV